MVAFLAVAPVLRAENLPVRYTEGSVRGILIVRDMGGAVLGSGELKQVVHDGQVSARLTFHFKDGSIDDQTTVFSQKAVFKLVRSHHVQRGPSFPHPLDMDVDVAAGTVTTRSDDGGKEKLDTQHMNLPADLCNGVVMVLIKNLRPDAGELKFSMLAGSTKPRIVKLAISTDGEEAFSIAGFAHKARHYVVKIQIGGLTGVVAPVVGKAPSDIHVWMMEGAPPTMLRLEGQLYESGPIWRVEIATPVWHPQS